MDHGRDNLHRGWAVPGNALAGVLTVLLAGLALLAVGCAGQQGGAESLPEFPHYEQADAFLEMQRRASVNRPVPPDPYAYSDFNRSIYRNLEEQKRLSQQEMEWRARQQEEIMRRSRASNQGEWEALQQRLSRDQALDVLRERELRGNADRFRQQNDARFRGYQQRLDRLSQEQQVRALEREMNRFRNQERIGQRMEELRKRQAQNLQLRALNAEAASQGGQGGQGAAAPTGGTPATPAAPTAPAAPATPATP